MISLNQKSYYFFFFVGIYSSFAQKQLNGVILDSISKTPIEGVSIYDEQSKKGTVSNERGEFEIMLSQTPTILQITHVSYKKERIVFSDKVVVKIYLSPSVIHLPEASVGNYGLQLMQQAIAKAISDSSHRYMGETDTWVKRSIENY
ncbi:MAG: carboxypeptidase-like regulatory domain-containing protein, partial [Saprospiraceae bacterium]|nr:carboxypeptidase-like regulatory domain-containing protein [Saprospiraceae bacterium]